MGMLSRVVHSLRVDELAKDLIQQVRHLEAVCRATGRQATGVELPMKGPQAGLYAAAVNRVLSQHPNLAVMKFADTMVLAERKQFRQTIGSDLHNFLEDQQSLTQPRGEV